MSFDEFLDRRLAELLRFAVVLAGDVARAEELVTRVMVAAFTHWSTVLGLGRPFAVVRTGVVRSYLSTSAPAPAGASTDLARRQRRAALVLSVYSGQTVAEVAGALAVPLAEATDELRAARAEFGLDGQADDVSLLARFDETADRAPVDAVQIALRVLDLLEAGPTGSHDAAAFDQLFATQLVAADEAGVPERPAGLQPAATDPLGTGAGDDPGVDLAPYRRRGPAVVMLSAAAVAVLAVVVALLVSHDRQPPVDASAPSVTVTSTPSRITSEPGLVSPVGHSLPGTKILANFVGSGSRTVQGGARIAVAGREFTINAVCSGPGPARIGPVQIPRCDGQPVGATVTAAQVRVLQVRSDTTTTWRFVIADEPDHGTSGSLTYPASPLLSSASAVDRVAEARGSGSGTVILTPGTTTARVEDVRLILSCSGRGVSFTSSDGRFDGQYTTTCFSGWSYEFDVPGVLLPGTLTVRATPTTSWRLVVLRG